MADAERDRRVELDALCPACIELGREVRLVPQKAKYVCPVCHHVEPCCQP